MKLKTLAPWKKSYDQPRQYIKKQRYYFADQGPSSQSYGFSSSHLYGCESWTIKKAECWRIDAFALWCWRRLLRVPWTARRSSLSILKESTLNIHWKADAEAETPILWPPDAKSWFTGKDADAGEDWRQEEKGATENETVGWNHGHESEQAPEIGDGQRSLACCSPWGRKELDTAERLNWTKLTVLPWCARSMSVIAHIACRHPTYF